MCTPKILMLSLVKSKIFSPQSATFTSFSEPIPAISHLLKACVRYFVSNFYFSPSNNPSKTMKNVFYFI